MDRHEISEVFQVCLPHPGHFVCRAASFACRSRAVDGGPKFGGYARAERPGGISGPAKANPGGRAQGLACGRRYSDWRQRGQRRDRQRGRNRDDRRPRRCQAGPTGHLLHGRREESQRHYAGPVGLGGRRIDEDYATGQMALRAPGRLRVAEAGDVVPGHRPPAGLSPRASAGGPRRPHSAEERKHDPDRLPTGGRRLGRAIGRPGRKGDRHQQPHCRSHRHQPARAGQRLPANVGSDAQGRVGAARCCPAATHPK